MNAHIHIDIPIHWEISLKHGVRVVSLYTLIISMAKLAERLDFRNAKIQTQARS